MTADTCSSMSPPLQRLTRVTLAHSPHHAHKHAQPTYSPPVTPGPRVPPALKSPFDRHACGMLSYVFLLPSMKWSHHVSALSRARTASPVAAGGRASRASELLPLHFIPSRSRASRKQTKVCCSPCSAPHAHVLPLLSISTVSPPLTSLLFLPYVRV